MDIGTQSLTAVLTEAVTVYLHKKTAKIADVLLFVPAAVYLGTADVVPSVQPMGNLFEQALLITFDMIVEDPAGSQRNHA